MSDYLDISKMGLVLPHLPVGLATSASADFLTP